MWNCLHIPVSPAVHRLQQSPYFHCTDIKVCLFQSYVLNIQYVPQSKELLISKKEFLIIQKLSLCIQHHSHLRHHPDQKFEHHYIGSSLWNMQHDIFLWTSDHICRVFMTSMKPAAALFACCYLITVSSFAHQKSESKKPHSWDDICLSEFLFSNLW